MKALLLASLLVLTGCASKPVAYDAQFCTWATANEAGKVQCRAWVIGPHKREWRFR
jgi:hypothetical protein